MTESASLRFGPLDDRTVHLCVDMQRLFVETEWETPWMSRVRPKVHQIVSAKPQQTVFTRFIPAQNPEASGGGWRRYYERWRKMTRDEIDPALLDLLPEFTEFVPPAWVFDKTVYSPWFDGRLHAALQARRINALVVTGGETDVCVLGSVMGAIDLGYRIVIVTDAICSSSDETHDALLTLYASRYSYQIEAVSLEAVMDGWILGTALRSAG
jgi:nicotinamidase-related amidase